MGKQSSLSYRFRRWAKRVAPPTLVGLARRPLKAIRSRIGARSRRGEAMLTREQLAHDLRQAGIADGDIVMVHTSLSKLGHVDGGAETVVSGLIDVVADRGTILMPCYNSADQMIREMKRGRLIDLTRHPAVTGAVTECFRTWPGVLRSSHPFSSVCAWGAQAEFVTSGHADRPEICHAASPVGRLVELDGCVVGLGISIAQGLGVAHCVEDTTDDFPIEVHTQAFEVTYIDGHGEQITREIRRYDPVVSETRIDYPRGRWILERLTQHLVGKGILAEFRCGAADAWIMPARPLYDELKRLATKGVTMYLTEEQLTDRNSDIENW
ncbi:MAG: AAC(3) family N-acetyltransferase [candidate division Zixibacteria bacterium]|nr:AAC(3) family N-acetyltransferase [candidate division Zixibacteria bacterium]MDH3937200.1 AAC(3) family N-acetyltransferase [candidate division Zixibacteria bacterium]